jgi:hypothetical protein
MGVLNNCTLRVNGTVVSVYTLKLYRRNRRTSLVILNLSTPSEVSDKLHTLDTLPLWEETQYPLNSRLSKPTAGLDVLEK